MIIQSVETLTQHSTVFLKSLIFTNSEQVITTVTVQLLANQFQISLGRI